MAEAGGVRATSSFGIAAGISAGIDMSLRWVERLAGPGLAQRAARQMDYSWIDEG